MSVVTRRALYGKLAGDTTLNGLLGTPASGFAKNIYNAIAPAGASYPYLIINKQAGTPNYTFQQGTAAFETDVWLVKAVDHNTTADPAENVQARLTTLLTDATLSISGEILMYLRRESDVDYAEVVDGEMYHHAGSLWRLVHEPS